MWLFVNFLQLPSRGPSAQRPSIFGHYICMEQLLLRSASQQTTSVGLQPHQTQSPGWKVGGCEPVIKLKTVRKTIPLDCCSAWVLRGSSMTPKVLPNLRFSNPWIHRWRYCPEIGSGCCLGNENRQHSSSI